MLGARNRIHATSIRIVSFLRLVFGAFGIWKLSDKYRVQDGKYRVRFVGKETRAVDKILNIGWSTWEELWKCHEMIFERRASRAMFAVLLDNDCVRSSVR